MEQVLQPDINFTEHWTPLIQAIHASEYQAVLAVTGGGSGAISALLETPGASRTVLEAVVPYSSESLRQWIGGTPDQACSEQAARAMAMAAWMRARELAPEADFEKLIGLGCTASLATDRAKRGEHRAHVAVQSWNKTSVTSLGLAKGERERSEEEVVVASLILKCLAAACQFPGDELSKELPTGRADELLRYDQEIAQHERASLLSGELPAVFVRPGSAIEHGSLKELERPIAVLSGAFDPPHQGHLGMAEIAEQRLGLPVAWEIAINNVDKPPLDFIALRTRVQAIRFLDSQRPILLTTAPTFRQKSVLVPNSVFVLGVDTIVRIDDPKYYNDVEHRNAAFATIKLAGCKFLVYGRSHEGKFQVLSDLHLSPALRELCEEVSAEEFREDVSSTELRAEA